MRIHGARRCLLGREQSGQLDIPSGIGPSCDIMKRVRSAVCALLIVCAPALSALGADAEAVDKAEILRTGMTIGGAVAGLLAGANIGISFSLDAIDTPLSNALLLTIPAAAAGAATGALAGRWIADTVLRHEPSPFFAIIEGAGLGLVAGALVGGITFSLNFAIAQPLLDVPEGYWGNPPIPAPAMAFVAGGFWGGVFGMIGGAIAVPVISLLMGF